MATGVKKNTALCQSEDWCKNIAKFDVQGLKTCVPHIALAIKKQTNQLAREAGPYVVGRIPDVSVTWLEWEEKYYGMVG